MTSHLIRNCAEASDDPGLDPHPGLSFDDTVTEAVDAAVEALLELDTIPSAPWVSWKLADIVRDAAITALNMCEEPGENATVVDPSAAVMAVMAAWHRQIRESYAFTTYESAVQMCDRMDAATAATRLHLAAEWIDQSSIR